MATPITVGIPRATPWFTPLFVAIDRGFFAEEGLEATVRTQSTGAAKLVSGEVDFSSSIPGRSGYLNPSALSVRMVCGHGIENPHVLMMREEVESVKRIARVITQGTGTEGGGLASELEAILGKYGVDLETSGIALQGAGPGGHPDQYAMLQEGIGDAAIVGPPLVDVPVQGRLSEHGQRRAGPAYLNRGRHLRESREDRERPTASGGIRSDLCACEPVLP